MDVVGEPRLERVLFVGKLLGDVAVAGLARGAGFGRPSNGAGGGIAREAKR